MNEEQLNNIDKPEFPSPIQGWKPTAQEAIIAVNRLLWSDGVEGDDHEEANTIKAFLVDTLPNTVVTPNMSKSTPAMQTTIEGAQKRIAKAIEDYADRCEFIGDPCETSPDLEYIGVFIDTIGDEMAAMSSAYDSMHDRYVQALATIEEWKDNFEARDLAATRHLEEKIELQKEVDRLKAQAKIDKATINASLSSIHAANDNR
jgi:hypothetical protein